MTDVTQEQRLELLAQEIEFIGLEIKRLKQNKRKHENEHRQILLELSQEWRRELQEDGQ